MDALSRHGSNALLTDDLSSSREIRPHLCPANVDYDGGSLHNDDLAGVAGSAGNEAVAQQDPGEEPTFPTLAEATKAHIERALVLTHGRIEGRGGAADLLRVNPHTLRGKMRRLRLDWARFRPAP